MQTAHMREMSQIGLAHQQELGRKIRLRGHADKAVRAPITPCRRYENYQTKPTLGAQFKGSKFCEITKRSHRSARFKVLSSKFKVAGNGPVRIFVPFVSLWFTLEII